jgi:hypothetical protein
MMVRSLFILFMASLLTGCSVFGIRSGYEQPSYVLVGTLSDQIEMRRYAPRLAVETSVDIPDYDEARSAAFRPLFDYISGANRTNESLAMTAPAEAALTSEKVTMTAPVETSRAGTRGMRMRFFLPAEFTLETAPQPIDPRVHLIEVAGQLQAVLRFSGFASEDAIAKKTKALLRALDQSTWRAASEPVTYLYDPPWTIPFFRRNEIVIPVFPTSS